MCCSGRRNTQRRSTFGGYAWNREERERGHFEHIAEKNSQTEILFGVFVSLPFHFTICHLPSLSLLLSSPCRLVASSPRCVLAALSSAVRTTQINSSKYFASLARRRRQSGQP